MAPRQVVDVTKLIDEREIGVFGLTIVALTFLVMVSDGYDLQALSFAAPGIFQAWHINRAALAPALSASPFGMMLGGPLFAYFADRFGRRRAIIWGAVFYGCMTLATAAVQSLHGLLVLRFLAGIGIGGLPPVCIALNAEFAPKRARATLIVLMSLGLTFGSMSPALVTILFGQNYHWQTLFVIGGIGSLATAVVLICFLPESVKFLVLRRTQSKEIAKLVGALRPKVPIAPDAEFLILESNRLPDTRFTAKLLFEGGFASITLLIWLLFFVNVSANFFLHSWMPVLFRDAGLSLRQMGITTAMYDVGAVFGALIASRLLDRYGLIILSAFFLLGCPAVSGIGLNGISVATRGAAVFGTGFCIIGIQLALGATVGIVYPTSIRANGAGWAISISRLGAILGPLAGGWLLSMHISRPVFFVSPIVPLGIGVVGSLTLWRACKALDRNRDKTQPQLEER